MTATIDADLARALVRCTSAIDAGDGDVMPVWADILEEMGDPRSAGLRRIATAERRYLPELNGDRKFPRASMWRYENRHPSDVYNPPATLPLRPWILLVGHIQAWRQDGGAHGPATGWKLFPTPSAAFLALAVAMIAE